MTSLLMGICASSEERASKQRSLQIDRELEQDFARQKTELKILLLGSGESGKSTIVKQMKIIHQNGYTPEELQLWKLVVYRNTIDSIKDLLSAAEKLHLEFDDPKAKEAIGIIQSYTFPTKDPRPIIPETIVNAIATIWQDEKTPECLERGTSQFYIMDSASYFLSNVNRVTKTDYLPTQDDVLRARLKTTGISETHFKMGQLNAHMFDVGGQRSERKKWIHCFEAVTSIIFCVALSEYDQVLQEESRQNRMIESLVLFESVINSRWFVRTSVILLLNKIDLFREKLARVPLENYFPDYNGGPEVTKGAKYILRRFSQANRIKLRIYPHLTQATDTKSIVVVFRVVEETLLKTSLTRSGLL
ncbi:guanine nucleotide-binding protein alpha-3 subunit [Phycomyces blakesleeanus]|uniref:Guanine nucleotide-binding protein alpha-3 subunit n=1 Tax=Phycomyces blakesleeanus TaxID=4837 RepID=A0ABR3BFQ5_PHYBL